MWFCSARFETLEWSMFWVVRSSSLPAGLRGSQSFGGSSSWWIVWLLWAWNAGRWCCIGRICRGPRVSAGSLEAFRCWRLLPACCRFHRSDFSVFLSRSIPCWSSNLERRGQEFSNCWQMQLFLQPNLWLLLLQRSWSWSCLSYKNRFKAQVLSSYQKFHLKLENLFYQSANHVEWWHLW